MLRTVIVEDETPNQEVLLSYLKAYCPDVEVVAVASTLDEGIEFVKKQQPDLIFLDIKLDGGNNGFDLLNAFDEINFQVIFVTAYDEYIKKALNETEALYYITKPIKISELEVAVDKAKAKIEQLSKTTDSPTDDSDNAGLSPNAIKDLIKRINPNHKIPIPIDKGLELVPINSIVRVEALGNFVQFHFVERKKITVYQNLTHYEKELQEYNFMRVHRSHLINLKRVQSFQNRGKGGLIYMSDESDIQISANHKKEFLQRLQDLY